MDIIEAIVIDKDDFALESAAGKILRQRHG
jgi:hypothetical protein